jgi:hypothetical protein
VFYRETNNSSESIDDIKLPSSALAGKSKDDVRPLSNEIETRREGFGTGTETRNVDQISLQSFLKSIARDGDIILPAEICVLRREETFKQWKLAPSVAASKRHARRQVEPCEASRSDWDLRVAVWGAFHRSKRAEKALVDWNASLISFSSQ